MFGNARSKAQLEQMKRDYLENLSIEVNNANILASRQRAKDEGIPPVPPQYKSEEDLRKDEYQIDRELVNTIVNEFDYGYSTAEKIKNALDLDQKVKILALFPSFKNSLFKDVKKVKMKTLQPDYIQRRIVQFLRGNGDELLGLNYSRGKNSIMSMTDLRRVIPSKSDIQKVIDELSKYEGDEIDNAIMRYEALKDLDMYKFVDKLNDKLPSTRTDAINSLVGVYSSLNLPTQSDLETRNLLEGGYSESDLEKLIKLSEYINRKNLQSLYGTLDLYTQDEARKINMLDEEVVLDNIIGLDDIENPQSEKDTDFKLLENVRGTEVAGETEPAKIDTINNDRGQQSNINDEREQQSNVNYNIESIDLDNLLRFRDEIQLIRDYHNGSDPKMIKKSLYKNILTYLSNNARIIIPPPKTLKGKDASIPNMKDNIFLNYINNHNIRNGIVNLLTMLDEYEKEKNALPTEENFIKDVEFEVRDYVGEKGYTDKINEMDEKRIANDIVSVRYEQISKNPRIYSEIVRNVIPDDVRRLVELTLASKPFEETKGENVNSEVRNVVDSLIDRVVQGKGTYNPSYRKIDKLTALEGKGTYNPSYRKIDKRTALEGRPYYTTKPIDNKSGRGLERGRISVKKLIGKGVAIEEQPRYKQFGKYVVNYHNLVNGVANFKYPSLGGIKEIKSKTISDEYKDFLLDVLDNNRLNDRLHSKLDEDEQVHFYKVCKGAGLLEKFRLQKKETDEDIEDIDRFNLLRGSYIAGNNSESVIKELRQLIVKFIKQERITKREGTTLLMEIV